MARAAFFAWPASRRSPAAEGIGQAVAEKLQSMGVKRVLVVTSNYHTRRAGKIFHRAMPGLTVLMVAAPDENFKPNGWWRNREARKTFVLEWEKTISEW